MQWVQNIYKDTIEIQVAMTINNHPDPEIHEQIGSCWFQGISIKRII